MLTLARDAWWIYQITYMVGILRFHWFRVVSCIWENLFSSMFRDRLDPHLIRWLLREGNIEWIEWHVIVNRYCQVDCLISRCQNCRFSRQKLVWSNKAASHIYLQQNSFLWIFCTARKEVGIQQLARFWIFDNQKKKFWLYFYGLVKRCKHLHGE